MKEFANEAIGTFSLDRSLLPLNISEALYSGYVKKNLFTGLVPIYENSIFCSPVDEKNTKGKDQAKGISRGSYAISQTEADIYG